jgi:branched-chain amino acid aminotransferase
MSTERQVNSSNAWPAELPAPEWLGFGRYIAPYAVVADHSARNGWSPTRVTPRGDTGLVIASGGLQYGLSVFEGLKAYRSANGAIHLFRPQDHLRRLQRSARRLCLPAFDLQWMHQAFEQAVCANAAWIPPVGQGSLYLRPTLLATEEVLGLRAAAQHQLVVVATPCSVPQPTPKRLWAERELVRAAPGGLGAVKTAANYAASLMGVERARANGYDDVLWLDAAQRRYLREAGAANVFVVLDDRVLTPQLDDTILAGITRDTAIALLRGAGHRVDECAITLDELQRWSEKRGLREMFGVGTAARLFPIAELAWDQHRIEPRGGSLALWLERQLAAVQETDAAGWSDWRVAVLNSA